MEWLEALRGTGIAAVLAKLFLSVLCGGVIGLERGFRGQAAGFRTHILVCTGACIAMLTGQYIHTQLAPTADPARLGAQVISGIGFLGAGTIISTQFNRVRGLTTAAGLWAAACIGLAVGIGFFEAALGGAVVTILAIMAFWHIDKVFYARSPLLSVYMELESIECVKNLLATTREHGLQISTLELLKPKSGSKNRVGISLVVKKNSRKGPVDMLGILSSTEGLAFIEEIY